jgi:hypothetical protein
MTEEDSNHPNIESNNLPRSPEITPNMALKSLGEFLIENSNLQNCNDFEAFEQYTYTLQNKIQNRTHDFPERFSKGYDILCNELKKS